MAGNEKVITEFLFKNLGKVKLKHLGLITKISVPGKKGELHNIDSCEKLILVTTQASGKKADIYLNGKGISLKQGGANFGFNRMQRSELLDLFKQAGLSDPNSIVNSIDNAITDFHNGKVKGRNRVWKDLMSENDFKKLMKYLMTVGSPNLGDSDHQVDFILEAPSKDISEGNINVYSFDEYFEKYKLKHVLALRRCWVGQSSDSEHGRAVGLASKVGNKKWTFKTISGQPGISKSTGQRWRDDIVESDRRTVYIVFIEKLK